MELIGVQSRDVDTWWEQAAPFLESALDISDGRFDLSDIYKAVKETDMQLWIAVDSEQKIQAACITQILIHPRKKTVLLLFCGGKDVNAWVQFIETIQAWAKFTGCTSAEIYGRPGWEKILPTFGFKKACVYYSAEL